MAATSLKGPRIAGIVTCVPSCRFDNQKDTKNFTKEEIRKVTAMAGVSERRLADNSICSSDLCITASESVLEALKWERDSIDALIMVTQSPDYFLPSTSCVVHKYLRLSDRCAAFDVGLGCSGYPYGLWMAAMMLQGNGFRRVLLLHGETPGRFAYESDRSVSLLFGDAGSATAMEANESDHTKDWYFLLHTDGEGYRDMIIPGGGFRDRFSKDKRKYFVEMNGANVFNFTIKRVPPLIQKTLQFSGFEKEEVDYFIFHQSNQFIIRHLIKKTGIPDEKVPMTLKTFGNTGGPSIPRSPTNGGIVRPMDRPLNMMLLGYGVGLSSGEPGSTLYENAILGYVELNAKKD